MSVAKDFTSGPFEVHNSGAIHLVDPLDVDVIEAGPSEDP
jgi:hypothetical protein